MKLKLYYKNDKIKFLFVYISLYILVYISTFNSKGFLLSILLTLAMLLYFFIKVNKSNDISNILFLPIFLSLFQNTYLGILSPRLEKSNLQFFTILNFLIGSLFLIMLLYITKEKKQRNEKVIILLVFLIIYSLLSLVFLENVNLLSVLSSIRNVISIFVFYLLGSLAYKKTNISKFKNLVMFFGVIVILIGFYEVFINQDMWKLFNISTLWTKKGITLQPSGLPTNFYSSETINGERIRRMTSTFADPVNLGTFLSALFCMAFNEKNKKIITITLLAMILTVSKGSLLSLLIFTLVYILYRKGPKAFLNIIIPILGIGVLFLVYAYKTSANSVFLHISGLFSSFISLTKKPLGNGLGSTGVLAKQFSGVTSNANITESGLGMIIGQLGIIGLILYILFFKFLYKNLRSINNINDKILGMTLFISISVNILFNEVALSPNSCALYFIIIGYLIAKKENVEVIE